MARKRQEDRSEFEPTVSEATLVADDVVEDTTIVENDGIPNENEVVDSEPKAVCGTCNDTGAVPVDISNGVVTKWKDCPNCHRVEEIVAGVPVEKRELNVKPVEEGEVSTDE